MVLEQSGNFDEEEAASFAIDREVVMNYGACFTTNYSIPNSEHKSTNHSTPLFIRINQKESTENLLNENTAENHKVKRHWIGIPLAILSAMAFSSNALIVKTLDHFNSINLGIWTMLSMTVVSTFPICFELCLKKNTKIIDSIGLSGQKSIKLIFYLFLRGIIGVSTLVTFFCALKYLTVADAIVIHSSCPIVVYILAFLFLREPFGLLPVFTTVLVFIGVTLITRPPILTGDFSTYDTNILIGVAFAGLSMFCLAAAITMVGALKTVHYTVIIFTFSVLGTFICLIISCICGTLSVPETSSDICKIVGSGLMFYFAQTLLTVALQYENAGPVGLLRTTEVLFIFIWQFVFLGILPDIYSVFGAVLVIFGAVLTILRKWISTLPDDNSLRQKFKFLLH